LGIPTIETAGVPVGAIFIEDGREFWVPRSSFRVNFVHPEKHGKNHF
jgi:hypothetical protein